MNWMIVSLIRSPGDSEFLPMLSFVLKRGNVTVYEWKYGEPPPLQVSEWTCAFTYLSVDNRALLSMVLRISVCNFNVTSTQCSCTVASYPGFPLFVVSFSTVNSGTRLFVQVA